MMMQMKIRGHIVSYPLKASFAVEARTGRQKYHLVAEKADISAAVSKFERVLATGKIARISYVENGKFHPMYFERPQADPPYIPQSTEGN